MLIPNVFRPELYWGFDDGTYIYPFTPLYPDWNKDVEIPQHDYSTDSRSEFEKKLDQLVFDGNIINDRKKQMTLCGGIFTVTCINYVKVFSKRPLRIGPLPYLIALSVVLPTIWFLTGQYMTAKFEKRKKIVWYMRNHKEDWPLPRPRKTYAEVIVPWFPVRGM